MTEAQPANSGELSSFLHLTGWRPLLLAIVAGLAGAYGLFLALDAPAQWQARYVLNANRIADDDLTTQELDIFVEEIAQTARFPQVVNAVEERLGLVNEEDYDINVNQSGSSAQFVDINVVTQDESDAIAIANAQAVAIETGIEAMTITLESILGGHESAAELIQEAIDEDEARILDLTVEAGGFTPSVAYGIAVDNVVTRRLNESNPPQAPCTLADGTQSTCDVELTGPPLADLEAEVARLAPIEREFTTLDANVQAANDRLVARNDSIRDTQAALAAVQAERETPQILDEVVTEETSRIAGLLTGLLIFAIPAALLVILLFFIYDLLRPKPAIEAENASDFEAAGAIEFESRRELPEAMITPLSVVDEETIESDVLNDDNPDGDDDPNPPAKPKDSRWGRNADTKAG